MLKTNQCLTVLISQWLQILILPVREQHLPFLKAEISNLYHAFLISEHRASSYKCWLMKSAIHLDSAIFLKCLLGFFHVSHSQSTHLNRFPIYCAFNILLIEFLNRLSCARKVIKQCDDCILLYILQILEVKQRQHTLRQIQFLYHFLSMISHCMTTLPYIS